MVERDKPAGVEPRPNCCGAVQTGSQHRAGFWYAA